MTIKYFIGAAIAVVGLSTMTSCEKDLMTYEGDVCAYFDVRWGVAHLEGQWAHQYYSRVPFGATNDDDIILSNIDVRVTGEPSNKDRKIRIEINPDSSNVVVGEDVDPIDGDYIVKAGEDLTTLTLKFHRTKRMDGDTLMLQLKIVDGDGFVLNRFPNYDDENHTAYRTKDPVFDYNHDAQIHNIFIFDTLVKPAGWWGTESGGLFGLFSPTKWRLMMEISGTVVEDYASNTVMSSARAQAVGQIVGEYLWEKVKQQDPVIDENGYMMWVNAINTIAGSAAWTQTTTWEEYKQKH